MRVIKIRDQFGIERIYAAKFICRSNDTWIFDFKGSQLIVRDEDLIEIICLHQQIDLVSR